MADRPRKRRSTLLKIKTIMMSHFTLVRMAGIKTSTNNAGEGVAKREPSYTVDGDVNSYAEQYKGFSKN